MPKGISISWWGKHFGEEPPLVGNSNQGSGAIFFAGCNLNCCFCQNYQISNSLEGSLVSPPELASIMLQLQEQKAVNINLVSPTLWWKPLREALVIAHNQGLTIPIVWNSNAFEEVCLLKEFEGLVDIYLPDYKYSNNELAKKYSAINHYSNKALRAIEEMNNQVGKLKIEDNIAYRGLIVRHLILPNAIENSINALKQLSELNPKPFVSLMSQYNPLHRAALFPEINRHITEYEWNILNETYRNFAFEGWIQQLESSNHYNPDFSQPKPFSDN